MSFSYRYETAIHEAGHAAVLLYLGARVSRLSVYVDEHGDLIEGDSGFAGMTHAHYRGDSPSLFWRQKAVVTLAGYAAEETYASEGDMEHVREFLRREVPHNTATDFADHRKCVTELARLSLPGATPASVDHAANIVQWTWPAIVAIAADLACLGVLEGRAISMTYQGAMGKSAGGAKFGR